MSIKRISRRRIAAPIMDYVDNVISVDTYAGIKPDDTRTGGDVETKINPAGQSRVGNDVETRVEMRVESKSGPNVESRFGTK